MTDKVGDEGVFHIMPGDFDDPQYTDASLVLQFGPDVLWYPVVGNHELDSPAYVEWVRNAYDSLPYIVNEGPAGCETTTYSWDYGNAHFVALNQYYNGVSDTGAGGDVVDELYDWLIADLEANTQPAVFIVGHEPAYPEYRHVGDSLDQYPAHRDRFWKLLNDEKVIAYFCGHTHNYYAKQVEGPDWEPFTWQVDAGNAGNGTPNTFVDVTVTETEVIFSTWQGTLGSSFTNIEFWTVDIPGPIDKAHKPNPADGAVHPATWATLSWTAGVGAASHDVYFGENLDDVNEGAADTLRGSRTETSLTVGTAESVYPLALVPGATYYWRVDEVNDLDPNSPWKGDVWSFMTAPGHATQPDPAHDASGVLLEATLSWWPGLTAATHDVYFGINSPLPFIGNQGAATYGPGPLEPGTTYYWQIDEVEADGTTIYTGDIWSFATAPGYATQPDPANDAFVPALDTTLSWLPGPTVYFGTSSPPPFIGNQEAAAYYPGPLEPKTTYYWQIDEIEADGTMRYPGEIWSFRTPRPGTGTILREVWEDIGFGRAISDLTGHENYPHDPSYSDELT
ncbi:MAG: metallophosphoesterase family protein, partial [Planctomycetota bacterium]